MTCTTVLFVCTHNSARSQMAEGLVNALYADRYRAFSAGTEPSGVDPRAVKVMSELGIDISSQRSKSIDGFLNQELDLIVTVCDNAREGCPFIPGGKRQIHKSFEDPTGLEGNEDDQLAKFRDVRDEITLWLEKALISL